MPILMQDQTQKSQNTLQKQDPDMIIIVLLVH